MAGATGELGYSSQGRTPVKVSFEPINAGDYPLTLVGKSIEIKSKAEPGSLPYVNVSFIAGGTALSEGGKDRRVFHKLWLSLEPSPKTGTPPVDGANQILGLAKALGTELNFEGDDIMRKDKLQDDGETMKKVSILNPQSVVEWLQGFDGAEVRGHIKIRRASEKDKAKGYSDQNEIAYFMEEGATDVQDTEDEEVPRKNGKNGTNGHSKNGKRK